MVVKDKTKGKFINEWAAARESYETKFEDVDISNGISAILAIKDDDELVSYLPRLDAAAPGKS